eukprot:Pgem_evm1s5599
MKFFIPLLITAVTANPTPNTNTININELKSVPESTLKAWPNNTIHYRLDQFPDPKRKQEVQQAINDVINIFQTKHKCLTFIEAPNGFQPNATHPLLRVMDDNDPKIVSQTPESVNKCAAVTGAAAVLDPTHAQFLFTKRCGQKGNIMHEVMHALGAFHTHQRPDRDNFVIVNQTNIENKPEILEQFQKLDFDTYNITFDFDSIMLYNSLAGANDTNSENKRWTLTRNKSLAQRVKLSVKDELYILRKYQCPEPPPTNTTTSQTTTSQTTTSQTTTANSSQNNLNSGSD